MLRTYAKQSFVFYYHQDTHLEFGMSVWANNAWIAFQSIISGITGRCSPLWVLWQNATSLGTSAAVGVRVWGACGTSSASFCRMVCLS